jgi:vacuolar-type H+-ATPase subunit F/Vma7
MLGFVIGDNDMVTGFRLVGVEGTEVSSAEEAREAFEKALARSDLAIVVISEEFSAQPQLHEAIDRVRQESTRCWAARCTSAKWTPVRATGAKLKSSA